MDLAVLVKLKAAEGYAAQAVRLFQDCIEYRGEITRRRVDDAEHLGRRGLLFESLARLGDEAGIFDRDDGLVGKRGDKSNFPGLPTFFPLRSAQPLPEESTLRH
jgi:hypothetical protein